MIFELELEKYGFKEYKKFDVNLIRVDQEIRDLCKQNKCGQYGKNHMCPPAIKDIEEWKREILSFENAVIVTKVYPTRNSFDSKAMSEGLQDFGKTMHRLKKAAELQAPEKRKLFLGAGPCNICKKCTLLDNKPCQFPDEAFPAIEACGIDVMSLSISTGIKYNNGNNTVTFIGVILY